MNLDSLLGTLAGSEIFGYILMLICGAMTIIFIIVLASLLYHWHYYGIGFFRRWLLIAIFGGVGLALVASSWGLMFQLT